jgi:glycosyltransferase involved in cell wall biosynthesis
VHTHARPEISAIIPARNAAGSLPALLESLRHQTVDSSRYEVLVVDNGSTDAGAHIARDAGARVIEHPLPNRAAARNLGAAHARSDLFAFTDADCVATPRWLEALLACSRGEDMVAGPVTVTTADQPNAVERFERHWRFGQEAWVREGWAATANLCIRRAVMDAVGGLDPAYRHIGEDADFCVRALREGYRIGWCAEAEVEHPAESAVWPMLKRSYWHGYSGHQTHRRIGVGYRAWRRPSPLIGDRALRMFGAARESFEPEEWRHMARLARAGYAARMLGSLWGELRRVG